MPRWVTKTYTYSELIDDKKEDKSPTAAEGSAPDAESARIAMHGAISKADFDAGYDIGYRAGWLAGYGKGREADSRRQGD